MTNLPPTNRIRPRPVLTWWARRVTHGPPHPTDEEKRDAIEVLREGPDEVNPYRDFVYRAAERCLHEAAENEEAT